MAENIESTRTPTSDEEKKTLMSPFQVSPRGVAAYDDDDDRKAVSCLPRNYNSRRRLIFAVGCLVATIFLVQFWSGKSELTKERTLCDCNAISQAPGKGRIRSLLPKLPHFLRCWQMDFIVSSFFHSFRPKGRDIHNSCRVCYIPVDHGGNRLDCGRVSRWSLHFVGCRRMSRHRAMHPMMPDSKASERPHQVDNNIFVFLPFILLFGAWGRYFLCRNDPSRLFLALAR